MIFTTTPSVEGKNIAQYHGVVSGNAVLGVNIFKDVLATVRDIVGGRSQAYEGEMDKGREAAFSDLSAKAREFGADAVVGIDIDYAVIGNGLLMISISGTAVSFK